MKRILSIAVAIVLLFSVLPPSASADECENVSDSARAMMTPYTFRDTHLTEVYNSLYHGTMIFEVVISGYANIQSGNYVTVNSAIVRPVGGAYYIEDNVTVTTRTDTYTGRIYYTLNGSVKFGWTNPDNNVPYVHFFYFDNDEYYFEAVDYI